MIDSSVLKRLIAQTGRATINEHGKLVVEFDSDAISDLVCALNSARATPSATSIDALVDRFLGWRLPSTFAPDCGISFDGRHDDEWNMNKPWPIGTNLLTAAEAKEMFKYCLGPATGKIQS